MTSNIRQWLEELGLRQYAEAFERADIDLEILSEISEDDLKDLGVSLGHRRKIAKALRGPGADPVSEVRSPQISPPPLSYTPRHLAERILTARSSLEGERKQVTVLFADVAGFTALSERLDPEVVHTIMDGCFAILSEQVHHYEGTINQYTGDGIMALFGAPIAHEDHALRAGHAAYAIQQALAEYGAVVQERWGVPFQMRIGLNSGPVVVGRIGDDLRMDYTAQGDTVNLAARMQAAADPGTILAGEPTRRIAGEAFRWSDLGAQQVRGRNEPVRTFRVDALQGDSQSRFEVLIRRGLTPLVGRSEELGVLVGAWAQAHAHAGRVISVVGEAGLGKSRLIYEFKRHLGSADARFVEGTCFTYGASTSFLPFLAVVRSLCGVGDGADEASAKEAIGATLVRLGLAENQIAPFLYNALSYRVEDPVFTRMTAELVRRRTVEALTALVFAEAAIAPLALIIEDMHWIDKATEEVIGALVEGLAAAPLLLVLAYRPEYLRQWGEIANHAEVVLRRLQSASGETMVRAILTKSYAESLALKPLSAIQSTAVARRILGERMIPPELERLIAARTEGNPLFVEELTRSLVEGGALRETADGAWVLTRSVEDLDIPPTLQGVLLARIDRLPEELKETLQVAAAIGRVFARDVLAKASPVKVAVDDLLLRLQDLDFVYPAKLGPQRDYSFKHVLVQEAVYSTLLKSRRATIHEAIGRAIETLYPDALEEHAEVLARHFEEAGSVEKALTYLELANAKAARASAIVEARQHFERAWALFDQLPKNPQNEQRKIVLLAKNVIVFQLQFMLPEYYGLVQSILASKVLAEDHYLGAIITGRAAHCEWSFGRLDEADSKWQKMGSVLSSGFSSYPDHADNLIYSAMCQIWSNMMLSRPDRFLDVVAWYEKLESDDRHPRWRIWARTGISLGLGYMGDFAAALDHSDRVLATAESYGDLSLIAFAHWGGTKALACRGDFDAAIAHGLRGMDIAPTPADKTWVGSVAAWAMCHAGRLSEAIPMLEAMAGANIAGNFVFGQIMAAYLADGYRLAGRYDDARRTISEVLDYCERASWRYVTAMAERLWGEVELAESDGQAALEKSAPHFRRAIEIGREIRSENELAHSLAGLGRLHLRVGDRSVGIAHLKEALALYLRLGTQGAPNEVHAALVESECGA